MALYKPYHHAGSVGVNGSNPLCSTFALRCFCGEEFHDLLKATTSHGGQSPLFKKCYCPPILQRRRAFLYPSVSLKCSHFFIQGFGGCNPQSIFTILCGMYIF